MKNFREFSPSDLFALCLGAIVFCISIAANTEEIYKSVDAQGRAIYSDRPSNSARRIELHTPRPDTESAQANRERALAIEQANARRKARTTADQADRIKSKEAEDERKEGCQAARDRYLMFTERPRVYRRDAQGNRVYYSSEEINAERAAAQQKVSQLCGVTTQRAASRPR